MGKWILKSCGIIKGGACLENGEMTYTCIFCGESDVRESEKGDHDWEAEYIINQESICKKVGVKSIHCSVYEGIKYGSEIMIP